MEFRNKARSPREQRKSSRMARFFRRLRKSQSGPGVVEYIIIVAVMAIFTIMALFFLNNAVHDRIVWIGDAISYGIGDANRILAQKRAQRQNPVIQTDLGNSDVISDQGNTGSDSGNQQTTP